MNINNYNVSTNLFNTNNYQYKTLDRIIFVLLKKNEDSELTLTLHDAPSTYNQV